MAAKKTKRKAKSKPAPREAFLDAALDLIELQGWRGLTMRDIAEAADLPLAELRREFASKDALLAGFMARTDGAMMAGLDDSLAEEKVRARLFEVIMSRLDTLTPRRKAVRNLIADLSKDPPSLACFLAGPMRRSVRWMLEAAHVDDWGPLQPLQEKGLGLLYLATLRVWLKGDEVDDDKVMAALDRGLTRIDGIIGVLQLRPCRRGKEAEDERAGD